MTDQIPASTSDIDPSKNQVSEKDLKFIEIRRRFLRSTYKMGFLLSAFLAGLFLWLLFTMPDMINPFHVQRQISSNALSVSFLKVMAVLLPLMVLMAFFLAASIILFGFSAFANERHYLKIIDSLLAGQPREDSLPTATGKDLKETKRKKKAIKNNNLK
jgi:hypothetical protein